MMVQGKGGRPVIRENGLRSLAVSFRYIDTVLSAIEEVLEETASRPRAFLHYIPDIPAPEREELAERVCAFRERLRHEMGSLGISPHAGAVPASRVVRADLTTIEITLEELKRKDWADLGLSRDAAEDLCSAFSVMQEMVAEMAGIGASHPPGGQAKAEGDKQERGHRSGE